MRANAAFRMLHLNCNLSFLKKNWPVVSVVKVQFQGVLKEVKNYETFENDRWWHAKFG